MFICSLYTSDKKAGTTADHVRYWMFCQKYQKNESLPPTSDSLSQHINGANYQAYVWKKSLCKEQDLRSPETNGWIVENGKNTAITDDQRFRTDKPFRAHHL